VLNILEDDPAYRLEVVLANAQQVKAVTGHKTDPQDARWLAHLLRHGMIRPSFIPPRAQRELRDLTRRRKQMVRAAAEERNRVQKVLEDANVKIGDVLSDVFGLSGQLMLEALVAGPSSAGEVAQLLHPRIIKGTFCGILVSEGLWCHACCGYIQAHISG
jgi:transposase